jgi:hypothetical protein
MIKIIIAYLTGYVNGACTATNVQPVMDHVRYNDWYTNHPYFIEGKMETTQSWKFFDYDFWFLMKPFISLDLAACDLLAYNNEWETYKVSSTPNIYTPTPYYTSVYTQRHTYNPPDA